MEPILVERTSTRMSLAVSLVDDYTDGQPIGDIKLTMDEKEAIRNTSGYCLFVELPAGDYMLRAETQYYFSQEVDVTLPLLGEPVTQLTLKPNPSYPFPDRATLVRGMVSDTEGGPIEEATVEIEGKEVENEATRKGEFVLYFKVLKEQDIIKINGKRYVRGDGNEKLQLQFTHPGYEKETALIEVEEGKTTSVSITLKKGG
jgi:hypothetical protein